jgi:hypothetical protein
MALRVIAGMPGTGAGPPRGSGGYLSSRHAAKYAVMARAVLVREISVSGIAVRGFTRPLKPSNEPIPSWL